MVAVPTAAGRLIVAPSQLSRPHVPLRAGRSEKREVRLPGFTIETCQRKRTDAALHQIISPAHPEHRCDAPAPRHIGTRQFFVVSEWVGPGASKKAGSYEKTTGYCLGSISRKTLGKPPSNGLTRTRCVHPSTDLYPGAPKCVRAQNTGKPRTLSIEKGRLRRSKPNTRDPRSSRNRMRRRRCESAGKTGSRAPEHRIHQIHRRFSVPSDLKWTEIKLFKPFRRVPALHAASRRSRVRITPSGASTWRRSPLRSAPGSRNPRGRERRDPMPVAPSPATHLAPLPSSARCRRPARLEIRPGRRRWCRPGPSTDWRPAPSAPQGGRGTFGPPPPRPARGRGDSRGGAGRQGRRTR